MSGDRRYWFAAKRYGWGWSLPLVWQGWVVYIAFVVLLVSGFLIFRQVGKAFSPFWIYEGVLLALLFAVCWLKGEPPRWRWGKDESENA